VSDGEGALAQAAAALSCPRILVEARQIVPGDEQSLLPEEAASIAVQQSHSRRASGAARRAARDLLRRLGFAAGPVPKAASGAPLWPEGVVGSLAHDEDVAVAAVARASDIVALGIDVEPDEPLPPELRDLVLTPRERRTGTPGRLAFSAKEAVYKAIAAFDGTLLDYQDIETDFDVDRASLADGRSLMLRHTATPRPIVLAFIAID
jgi:4'-phosphopantetheinyl transferase EntD